MAQFARPGSKTSLSRRAVLRGVLGGAAIALPLPRLLTMLNGNGTAYAAGEPLPRRFGTWFFGNGIIPARWIPTKTGKAADWELSASLQPLTGVKDWLSIVSGLSLKVPNTMAHKSMPAAALTGAQAVNNGDVQLPSIDQLIAPLLGKDVVFPTGLHVGISNTTGAGALDFNVSFNGASAPNHPEYSPAKLFKSLLQFSSNTKEPDPALLRRKRVLDAVAEDAKALRARLGTEDQQRLERHLTGIDELQNQIAEQALPRACGTLSDPDVSYQDRGSDGAITRKRGQAFADLLVFAMSCDLTRVFSYVFTCAACHGSYADAGLDNVTFHEDYGHRLSPKGLEFATEGFHTGILYTMTNLADLVTRMRDTPDGAGNLLDNSCIYVTSCVSESQSHSGKDYPLLVLGKGGGALIGDQHVRLPEDNVSKVPFSLLKAMGSAETSWGKDEARVDQVIPDLLAT
jgi:hypothetical protein